MFQGLRTAIYPVNDLAAAKAWYTKILGVPPYFDEPFYIGFNVGGYELGLLPASDGVVRGNTAMAYWGVDKAEAAMQKLLEAGATLKDKVQDVGEGILVASVEDPFGNILGVIENPHFKLA